MRHLRPIPAEMTMDCPEWSAARTAGDRRPGL